MISSDLVAIADENFVDIDGDLEWQKYMMREEMSSDSNGSIIAPLLTSYAPWITEKDQIWLKPTITILKKWKL